MIARKVRLIHLIRRFRIYYWREPIWFSKFVLYLQEFWYCLKYMFYRIDFAHDLLYKSVICWELNWHSILKTRKRYFQICSQIMSIYTPATSQSLNECFFRFFWWVIRITFFLDAFVHTKYRVMLHNFIFTDNMKLKAWISGQICSNY